MSEETPVVAETTETPKRTRKTRRPEMLRVMIQLPLPLVLRARVRAVQERTTVSRLVEDRLLELLAAK